MCLIWNNSRLFYQHSRWFQIDYQLLSSLVGNTLFLNIETPVVFGYRHCLWSHLWTNNNCRLLPFGGHTMFLNMNHHTSLVIGAVCDLKIRSINTIFLKLNRNHPSSLVIGAVCLWSQLWVNNNCGLCGWQYLFYREELGEWDYWHQYERWIIGPIHDKVFYISSKIIRKDWSKSYWVNFNIIFVKEIKKSMTNNFILVRFMPL